MAETKDELGIEFDKCLEDVDTGKATAAQLAVAAAALSPGGYKGIRLDLTEAEKTNAKEKIRGGFRGLGKDIPPGIQVPESREMVQEFNALESGAYDPKGIAHVTIIKPGLNKGKTRFYPAEMLKRDCHIFEGNKMYADHASDAEERSHPVGRMKNWVAVLKNVRALDDGEVVGDAHIIEGWLAKKFASLKEAGMLGEAGTSIKAIGRGPREKQDYDGHKAYCVEELVKSRSVDFVTEAGAGGAVLAIEDDSESDRFDIDLVSYKEIEDRRPDIVLEIKESVRKELRKDRKSMSDTEAEVKELTERITGLEAERDELKGTVEQAEQDKARATAQADIKEAVAKAELPESASIKLLEQFKDVASADGVEDAKRIVSLVEELSPKSKVTDNGPGKSGSDGDSEDSKVRVYMKEHDCSFTDALRVISDYKPPEIEVKE